MSWRAIVSGSTQTSQPPRSSPAPNFYSAKALWCYFLVFLKKILSIFTGKLDFYQDPRVVSENVLQKHSPIRLYSSVNEALGCGLDEGKPAEKSSRSFMLNSSSNSAKWRFEIFDDPKSVPENLLRQEIEENFETWGESCNVPMSWQMPINQTKKSGQKDLPIYTNFKYPFPDRFSNLSTYISRRNNPSCVYRAQFRLPEQWCDEDYANEHDLILILHGAGPGVEVFANGHRLGYHTDSMTEHEYLLTPECVPRDARRNQLLTLRIFKYSSGSYLEDQDQWWLTGIHRDVELQYRPKAACMWDTEIRASFSAARVELSCALSLDGHTHEITPFFIRATLFDPPSNEPLETVTLPIEMIPRTQPSDPAVKKMEMLYLGDDRQRAVAQGSMFVLPKERIEPWTAETPKLYSLVLELFQPGNDTDPEQIVQVEVIRVGFRDVSLNPNKNGQFEVNGKRVVFRGVNRHEFSPHLGKVITEEAMVADILQMKRHNFNAVRNSHYPCNHRWYELCDYHGLYVIDESNIETHGFALGGAISLIQFDSAFRDAFLSRSYGMVMRSRNHPSIVCWSLGNESGFGPNSYDCSRLIRVLDDLRPVVYEGGIKSGVPLVMGDGRNPVSDFIFPMYHSPELIHSYDQESKQRQAPVVLCEYAHCMGNSGGGLHLYWDLFWREEGVWQGGFIWDWVDQGIAILPPQGSHMSSSMAQPQVERTSQNFFNFGSASSTHNMSAQNLLSPRRSLDATADSNSSAGTPMASSTHASAHGKSRRSSSVNFISPHREGEFCVSKDRLLDITFQGRGWGYGGDFGELSGKEDAQFCLNGVVFPDRSPKPVLYEAKYLMQPFRFILEAVVSDVVELTIVRRYDLPSNIPLEFGWTLVGEEIGRASDKYFGTFAVEFTGDSPKQTVTLKLKPTIQTIPSPNSSSRSLQTVEEFLYFYLRISCRLASACKWADAGHEIAHEVFELNKTPTGEFARALPPSPVHILPQLSVAASAELDTTGFTPEITLVDGTKQMVIRCDSYDARVDLKTGALVSFRGKDGVERIIGPSLLPIFYRACTDNDLGGAEVHVSNWLLRKIISKSYWSFAGRWRLYGLDKYDESRKWTNVDVTQQDGNTVVVTRSDELFKVETIIKFLEAGIRANIKVEWTGGFLPGLESLPRVGTYIEMAPQMSRITYAGRGPFENYSDRKRGASMGVYSQTADDFHVPYIFPSESGGRSDVRWMVMEDTFAASAATGAGIALSYSCLDAPEWGMDEENRLGDGPETFRRPAGTRGAQVSVSRFRVAQLDKARHQYELTRDLGEWRQQTLKVVIDTAHMGVGGDVSWLPRVHSPFKIKCYDPKTKTGSVWSYQIDLDLINKSAPDEPEELKRRASQLDMVRGSRSSQLGA